MLFIGSGSLLHDAVKFALSKGKSVDGVVCPVGDGAIAKLNKLGVVILESNNPNSELPFIENQSSDGVVFSINNKHILSDALLASRLQFFNVHNGLVQYYRGIAEVCVLAALCQGARQYGVTLQRLLPNQKVDCGPVVSQISFDFTESETFADVFSRSLSLCKEIFEKNLMQIQLGSNEELVLPTALHAWGYRDISKLLSSSSGSPRIKRACELGHYAALLPRLRDEIHAFFRSNGGMDTN